jgi:hypothetical protein
MNRKINHKDKQQLPASNNDALFERVVSVLEQARSNVVRAVNSEMIIAYWLIGREIVQEIQSGEKRAEYGKQVIKDLSIRANSGDTLLISITVEGRAWKSTADPVLKSKDR